MLFICDQPRHVAVRSEGRPLYDTRGNLVQPKTRKVWAKFKRGEAPTYARIIGMEAFPMLDRPVEIEAGDWLCAYDSVAAQKDQGWTDEERETIEQKLLEQGYMPVEKPRLSPPYPRYDQHRKTAGKRTIEHVVKDIVATFETAGFDVNHAVAYEQENLNDARVVAALNDLNAAEVPEKEADDDVVIAA